MPHTGTSPQVAEFIAAHPTVKAAMKVMLLPLLGILQLSTATFSLFSFNSELGIVLAGLVAAALIGAVYFTPIVSIVLIAVSRSRRSIPRPGSTRVLVIPWTASLFLILLAEVTVSHLLMMAATGSFVIVTIAIVAGATSLKIAHHWSRS